MEVHTDSVVNRMFPCVQRKVSIFLHAQEKDNRLHVHTDCHIIMYRPLGWLALKVHVYTDTMLAHSSVRCVFGQHVAH